MMKVEQAYQLSDEVVDLIKAEMVARDVSNYALSKSSGISEAHLSYIFNHKKRPSLYILFMIAKALSLKLSDILSVCEES